MPQVQPMNIHERLRLRMKCLELEKQGKIEEAEKLERQIPMSPWLAKFAKKYMGADYLIKYEWNLSEADAEYGADWLTR